MMFYVYTFRDTKGIFYVGKGKDRRAWDHLKPNYPSLAAKHIQKLATPPILEVWPLISEIVALELETKLIKLLGRKDLGTGRLLNLTDGGDGVSGVIRSEETKRKNSIANIGRIFTQEHRANISKSRLGTKTADHVKQQMSKSRKGKPQKGGTKGKKFSLESRQKMAAARIGKKLSQETKDKIRTKALLRHQK